MTRRTAPRHPARGTGIVLRGTHHTMLRHLSLPFAAFALVTLSGCPTRTPDYDSGALDASFDAIPIDPRVPLVGPGTGAPSCAADAVIDINRQGFRVGNEIRIRVDTSGRRNDLHPDCVDRDSSEAVLRYTAPDAVSGTPVVYAIRVSTVAPATTFDTVVSVRNDCGPEYHDYSCNNDGFLDDGLETRRSTVYLVNVEPSQLAYIVVDGYDGDTGVAEVVLDEIPTAEMGALFQPCIPVRPEDMNDPNAATASYRCAPGSGGQCRPGAASDGTDLCLPLVALDAPCDPDERRNVCEPYNLQHVVCAQNPMDRTQAVCALPGTAAGAVCRPSEPRCDGRLTCSPMAGFGGRDICVPLRGAGASCDPSATGFTNHCDQGLSCCGDIPDAGASFTCRTTGTQPCFAPAPMTP